MKPKKKKKTHIPFRLNLLFFIVFLLFSALILQLGVIQIVRGEDYKKEVERTTNVVVETPVPRGKIYDRNYNVIVDNTPLNAITYTRLQGATQNDRLEVARKLADLIEKDTSSVTERDLKDYWILTNPEEARNKLTEEELKSLEDDELYQLQLERITEADLAPIRNNPKEMEVVAIKREFDVGYALTPQIVKKHDVTDKEYAVVSENLENLPGVDTTTDWERKYVYGNTFRSFLGNISTEKEGIPRSERDYYLSRGYSLNDRVGISYLEKQYEDVLKGQKEKIINVTDKAGNLIERNVVQPGERGKDLILTIDMELQQAVEQIMEEEMLKAKRNISNPLLDSVFMVMMDPRTGEIYSLAGKKLTKDENGKTVFQDYSLGTTNNAYVMGSSVKGATVLTGYQTGVISPGQYLVDEPIKIKDTPTMSSHQTMGRVNDITALRRSSNVYMFKIAMAMGEYNYQYNRAAPFKNPAAFETMRNYFGQFGLGTKTGIDLPFESTGYKGNDRKIGSLMFLSIGQYDSYTTLQMAQYAATIANNGYRMKAQLVKEIRNPDADGVGNVIWKYEPQILNRVDMPLEHIKRVQEGFRQVMQVSGGTAYADFHNAPYNPAGKTGTAETFYWEGDVNSPNFGRETTNLSLVGYAPFDDPEIAFAIVAPYGNSKYRVDKIIARRALDTYFDLKEQRYRGNGEQGEEEENDDTGAGT